MAYGDNPKIVKDRTTTVTVEVDGYRPGMRGKITQRRFKCVGGPMAGAYRAEVDHRMSDMLPGPHRPLGYRMFNRAGRDNSSHKAVWVWFDE